jgi:hypothetical protein
MHYRIPNPKTAPMARFLDLRIFTRNGYNEITFMIDVFSETKKLNFPADQYVVFAGAALAARGIKETSDLDIIVTPELLEKCRNEGWVMHPRIDPNDFPALEKGVAEIYTTIGGGVTLTFKELQDRAEVIDGIPFCSLEDVIHIKKIFGREKDFKDIALIEEYKKRKNIL